MGTMFFEDGADSSFSGSFSFEFSVEGIAGEVRDRNSVIGKEMALVGAEIAPGGGSIVGARGHSEFDSVE